MVGWEARNYVTGILNDLWLGEYVAAAQVKRFRWVMGGSVDWPMLGENS